MLIIFIYLFFEIKKNLQICKEKNSDHTQMECNEIIKLNRNNKGHCIKQNDMDFYFLPGSLRIKYIRRFDCLMLSHSKIKKQTSQFYFPYVNQKLQDQNKLYFILV